MKRLFTLFPSFLFFAFGTSAAQSPVVVWQKCFGSYSGDYANSIYPTTDGGYIIGGYTESGGGDVMGYHGNPYIDDFWIVKIDGSGNLQWQKCLGGDFAELGAYVRQTPDGGYIVAGSSVSRDCSLTGNHGGMDFLVIKLAPDGDIIWQRNFGGSKHEYAFAIDLTTDGGYVVAGFSASSDGDVTVNQGNRDYWVVKLNRMGNLEWQKSLGGTGDDEAYSVRATSDGGCVMAGFTESNDDDVSGNHGKRDYWIVKLGDGGSLQWQKCLGSSESDEAWSLQLTKDGGYIAAGVASSGDGDVSGIHRASGVGGSDFWVVKLAGNGSLQWQKCYGGDPERNSLLYAGYCRRRICGGRII